VYLIVKNDGGITRLEGRGEFRFLICADLVRLGLVFGAAIHEFHGGYCKCGSKDCRTGCYGRDETLVGAGTAHFGV